MVKSGFLVSTGLEDDQAVRSQVSGSGSTSELIEIRASSSSEDSIPGKDVRFYFGDGVSVSGRAVVDPVEDCKDFLVCAAPALEGGVAAGIVILSGESSSLGSLESPGVSEVRQPGDSQRSRLVSYSDDDGESVDRFEVVASDGASDAGPEVCYASPVVGGAVRRLDEGLGICDSGADLSRSVVSPGAQAAHKCAGAASDRSDLSVVSGVAPGSSGPLPAGQFYGSCLREQAGWHKVEFHDGRGAARVSGAAKSASNASRKSYRGGVKRARRFSLSPRAGDKHGVAAKRRGFPVDRRRVSLGTPGSGPVCKQSQSPLKLVSVALSRRARERCRRADSRLARSSIVRVSAGSDNEPGGGKVADSEEAQGAASGSVSAQRGLVSELAQTGKARPVSVADAMRHVTAAALGAFSSESDVDEVTPVVGADAWLTSQGFSSKVSTRLATARSTPTNAIYDSKWKLFAGYCRDRGLNPYSADGPCVAEFLTFLFECRSASVLTIRGYRSALGSRLRHSTGFDPGQDETLSQLMRSFLRERPIKSKTLIKWDVGLVLRYLKTGKLGHTALLSPRDLTLKVVFLLALATGKRRSEIHALDREVGKVGDTWDAVRLRPRADFLGKTHFATGGAGTFSEIVVPAITAADGYELADLSLCPVRTLQIYLTESNKYRSEGQQRLIISYVKNKVDDIKKQTVSNYLKLVVERAYAASAGDVEVQQLYQMKAHDLRGIAASLKASRNATMGEILSSGVWQSASTFLKHYVKHFSRDELSNLYSLGPFVAAEKVIAP